MGTQRGQNLPGVEKSFPEGNNVLVVSYRLDQSVGRDREEGYYKGTA